EWLVNPFSAGSPTLQEAPIFASGTNDSGAQPGAARESVALSRYRCAPLVRLQRPVRKFYGLRYHTKNAKTACRSVNNPTRAVKKVSHFVHRATTSAVLS